MTRVEALKELLAKVEAGEWFPGLAQLSFGGVQNYHSAASAYNGSLDAAKALHDAVLPGWGWHIRQDEKNGSCHAHTLYPNYRVSPGGACLGGSPARAWLIAILKALIVQEVSQ